MGFTIGRKIIHKRTQSDLTREGATLANEYLICNLMSRKLKAKKAVLVIESVSICSCEIIIASEKRDLLNAMSELLMCGRGRHTYVILCRLFVTA